MIGFLGVILALLTGIHHVVNIIVHIPGQYIVRGALCLVRTDPWMVLLHGATS